MRSVDLTKRRFETTFWVKIIYFPPVHYLLPFDVKTLTAIIGQLF